MVVWIGKGGGHGKQQCKVHTISVQFDKALKKKAERSRRLTVGFPKPAMIRAWASSRLMPFVFSSSKISLLIS